MIEHFFDKIQGWSNNFLPLYKAMAELGQDGQHYVEVGAWKGQSAAFMATELYNCNKKIKFDVIDTWEGSVEHQTDPEILNKTLYQTFIDNMKPVEGLYTPIRLPSLEAVKLYKDSSLDFVFLDASHEYEDVKADILAWIPKIKSGGILAGDDYHQTSWPQVVRAVNDCFPGIETENAGWWYVEKQ